MPPIAPYDYDYQRPEDRTAGPCRLLANGGSSGLCTLEEGYTYYTVVKAVNQHGLESDLVRSTGTTCCTFAPDAGEVEVGAEAKGGVIPQIVARWRDFSDQCAPLVAYDVTVEAESGLANASRRVGNVSEARFNLTLPERYTATVCGINAAGLRKCATALYSTVLDVTLPELGAVCYLDQCTGASAEGTAYVALESGVELSHLHWHDYTDAESGMAGFAVAFGTESSESAAYSDLGYASQVDIPEALATHGTIAYFNVLAINGIGFERKTTLKLVFDATPPTFGADAVSIVSAGPADSMRNGAVYVNSASVSLRVDPGRVADAESPILELELQIRGADGGVAARHQIDRNSSAAELLAFSPALHSWYSATLYAVSASGLVSSSKVLRFLYDDQPPTNGVVWVCNTQGESIASTADRTSIRLCTRGFGGPRSGIPAHQVSVVGTANTQYLLPSIVVAVSSAGDEERDNHRVEGILVLVNLTLPCGSTLEITSAALSGAGVAAAGLTSTLLVDCTAPTGGIAVVGASGQSGTCVVAGARARASWSNFSEPESVITDYQYALVPRQPAPAGLTDFTSLDVQTTLLIQGDVLGQTNTFDLYVRACNDAGLCSETVQGLAALGVVETAPAAGIVSWNGTLAGYLGDARELSGSWTAFVDGSDVFDEDLRVRYTVCVGTTPMGCQAVPASAPSAERTWAANVPPLVCGRSYHLVVRAYNCAGLHTTASSSAATLCCASPETDAALTASSEFLDGDTVLAWGAFAEPCSGVASIHATLHAADGSLVWEADLNGSATTATIPMSTVQQLVDGKYTAAVEATSGARLASQQTRVVWVDTSAPNVTPPQYRWDYAQWHTGDVGVPACVASAAKTLELRWTAGDVQSGVGSAEVGFAVNESGPVAWHDVARASSIRIPLSLSATEETSYASVRICNHAGLCSTSAPSRMLRTKAVPSSGIVRMDWSGVSPTSRFLTDPSLLAVHWTGLNVTTCPAMCSGPLSAPTPTLGLRHEVAVGTTPLGEQGAPFSVVTSPTGWEAADLQLRCGHTYYASVRATSCDGSTRTAASEGAKLCCSGATGGRASLVDAAGDAVSFATNTTQLTAIWSGFVEPCSGGIAKYRVVVRVDDVEVAALEYGASAKSAALGTVVQAELLAHGAHLELDVAAISFAGLTSGAKASLLIDNTPPADSALELSDVETGELLSPSSQAQPDACIRKYAEGITIRWLSLVDKDTAMASFHVARFDALSPEALAVLEMANANWVGVGLVRTTIVRFNYNPYSVFVVRGCNAAGLCTLSSRSALVTWSVPAPTGGLVQIVPLSAPGVLLAGSSSIRAVWDGFNLASNASLLTYNVAFGTTPYGEQVAAFSSAGGPDSRSLTADGLELQCGYTYFATVRAVSCSGSARTVASKGATFCCQGPAGGAAELVSAEGAALAYASNASLITARWSGFVEPCSGGVAKYNVTLAVDGVVALELQLAPGAESTTLDEEFVRRWFTQGATVELEVLAVSFAGLVGRASASLVVDNTPPVAGTVVDASATCHGAGGMVRMLLDGFGDADSGVAGLEWALGSKPDAFDLRPWNALDPSATSFQWSADDAALAANTTSRIAMYVAVSVTNGAGLRAGSGSSVITVLLGACASAVVCLPQAASTPA